MLYMWAVYFIAEVYKTGPKKLEEMALKAILVYFITREDSPLSHVPFGIQMKFIHGILYKWVQVAAKNALRCQIERQLAAGACRLCALAIRVTDRSVRGPDAKARAGGW